MMSSHSAFLEEEAITERLQELIASGKLNEIEGAVKTPVKSFNPVIIHKELPTVVDAVPEATHTAILHLRDVSFELQALDVAISPEQIGLLLPMNLRIQTMKIRTKLKLEIEGVEYVVMYIGGNLVFKSNNCELRVLSFCRLVS